MATKTKKKDTPKAYTYLYTTYDKPTKYDWDMATEFFATEAAAIAAASKEGYDITQVRVLKIEAVYKNPITTRLEKVA